MCGSATTKREYVMFDLISHGESIKFLLLNWCTVNNNIKLEYEGIELNIISPCLLKLGEMNV